MKESERVQMALKILNRAREEVKFAMLCQERAWESTGRDIEIQHIGVHLDSIKNCLERTRKLLDDIDKDEK